MILKNTSDTICTGSEWDKIQTIAACLMEFQFSNLLFEVAQLHTVKRFQKFGCLLS